MLSVPMLSSSTRLRTSFSRTRIRISFSRTRIRPRALPKKRIIVVRRGRGWERLPRQWAILCNIRAVGGPGDGGGGRAERGPPHHALQAARLVLADQGQGRGGGPAQVGAGEGSCAVHAASGMLPATAGDC